MMVALHRPWTMYNRLFTKILDSSIWLEADATRIVWITLLAAMDEDGYAAFSCNENLARRANVPMDALESALTILESPDKFNPDDEFQGRRIERVDGGWLVLKAPYYRSLLSREIAREQNRLRVQKHREKLKSNDVTITKNYKHYRNTSEQSKAEYIKANATFVEWKTIRKAMGNKPKDWDRMFEKQAKWLSQFSLSDQIEILDQSIRNNWRGLFEPRTSKRFVAEGKLPAPVYPKLPPKREVSDAELEKQRKIVREASEKLKAELCKNESSGRL